MKCEACGSPVLRDLKHGEYVCSECGLVPNFQEDLPPWLDRHGQKKKKKDNAESKPEDESTYDPMIAAAFRKDNPEAPLVWPGRVADWLTYIYKNTDKGKKPNIIKSEEIIPQYCPTYQTWFNAPEMIRFDKKNKNKEIYYCKVCRDARERNPWHYKKRKIATKENKKGITMEQIYMRHGILTAQAALIDPSISDIAKYCQENYKLDGGRFGKYAYESVRQIIKNHYVKKKHRFWIEKLGGVHKNKEVVRRVGIVNKMANDIFVPHTTPLTEAIA